MTPNGSLSFSEKNLNEAAKNRFIALAVAVHHIMRGAAATIYPESWNANRPSLAVKPRNVEHSEHGTSIPGLT